jgi:hypothetical protein
MEDQSLSPALNEKKASRFLGVAVPTLRNWRHLRRGPSYYRAGRRVLYLKKDLISYREERRVEMKR